MNSTGISLLVASMDNLNLTTKLINSATDWSWVDVFHITRYPDTQWTVMGGIVLVGKAYKAEESDLYNHKAAVFDPVEKSEDTRAIMYEAMRFFPGLKIRVWHHLLAEGPGEPTEHLEISVWIGENRYANIVTEPARYSRAVCMAILSAIDAINDHEW